jgi:hypothetical protein
MKSRLLVFALFCIGALLSLGTTPIEDNETYWERQLRLHGKMNLPVRAITQSRYTSCGEAVITMAYNYAYPETRVTEQDVIDFALGEGYFTERVFPYTSPENMPKIASYYAPGTVSTGAVRDADEALAFLRGTLTHGDPVIIDTLSRLDDPKSGSHFVVVTGLEIDPANSNALRIYFNDPLTGTNRSWYWDRIDGVWNGWLNNGDPGGSGWWMVIASP